MTPALPNANDRERDDGADDEQADDGHAPVKVAPPSRALISRLVHVELVSEGGMGRLEAALATVRFRLVEGGIRRDREERGHHPG